ncbi:MAG: paraquat-inducible protein A, partial [Pseudomonadota bacterium]|nr:paraquat-inducible protein A [Pseudomonadota bacterium]
MLAWALAGLVFYAVTITLPFMDLELYGRSHGTVLLSAPAGLDDSGMWELAAVFVAFIAVFPPIKLVLLVLVLDGLRLSRPPRLLPALFRWYFLVSPWAMIEVFLVGLLVAYTRLVGLAHVDIGPGVWGLTGLMLAMIAADATLDPHAVWNAIEARGIVAIPAARQGDGPLIGCGRCGKVG